ncbi:MAG: dicarboxylate/amino acid:cation symporter, partial [Muribaculaceae bacterium]|nr:dicarboxylate/amino acid:cation symporter [Muribaculaceae bacterium]
MKLPLIVKILIAMVLGIGAGLILPMPVCRIFSTFNGIFSQFLSFLIPLLILGFVAPAIGEIGSGAGKMLVTTAIIAYVMTLASGLFSYSAGAWIFPQLITPGSVSESVMNHASGTDPTPFFTVEMPPMFSVMSALVLAFILGLGMAYANSTAMKSWFNEFRDIITRTISAVIIPLLPVYIFGIFLELARSGRVGPVLIT